MQDSSTPTTIIQDKTVTIAPASMIQRQFWLISQMQKDGSAYNIGSVFELNGPLEKTFLHDSINEIISRHDILRTRFSMKDGKIVQIIENTLTIPLVEVDLSSASSQKEECKKIISSEITRAFDLQNGPLIRTHLIKLKENKYVLSIVIHHILTDLKSKQIFGKELSTLYKAKLQNTCAPLSEITQKYADYATRSLEWLQTPVAQKAIDYWKQELLDQSGVLNLPLDHSRPVNVSDNGSHCSFALTQEQTQRLEQFSKQRTVNIFVTLLTAYLVMLARYTNQKQIVIGVPLSNRRHENDKETMGAFVNILPLSFDLTNITDINNCLKLVRMKMLTAHRHQEAPFEKIVDALKPKRDPSYNPIFQVGFTVEPHLELELENLTVSPIQVHNQGTQLDVFLNFKSLDPEISGYFEYNTDLFQASSIERMRTHYLQLLNSLPERSESPLNLLPMLTSEEQSQLLHDFNQTKEEYPQVCLSELIEQQVKATPDAIAAGFEGEHLTYSELDSKANQLANMLREIGISPGSLVGVYLERSLNMLIAICAIHKAGGAYVPLDTKFPVHRIGHMLEDAEPRVILSQESVASNLPENPAKVICMDRDHKTLSKQSTQRPSPVSKPEDLAYVIFTSGSTGRPKGVQVPQRAMVNFLWSMKHKPGITSKDTLLAVTTLSFDISVLELFLPLITGARVEIASSATAKDGQALFALLQSSGATIIQATPTTFHLLMGSGWNSMMPIKVLCGGELFPQDLAEKLCPRAESVWNMYGPTETTVWSTIYQIKKGQPVLVGCPIANTQIYIVNDHNQPTPLGVAGELLIGGDGVTHGYLHRKELNEKQFIADPFLPESQFKVYRTGDLACFLESGEIKILGRIDHQIKIRGFRIELGEIETAIVRHPEVKQGVAKTHDFGGGDVRLVAYITLNGEGKSISLRSYLKETLPDYMIPSVITVLEEMPLTLNNKIDRKALPQPDMSRSAQAEKIVQPQNKLEADIAQKWAQTLRLEQIGVDETFFDLGGNSRLSLQLISQLEQDLQIKIPIVKFYQYPTVRLLANYLQSSREKGFKSTEAAGTPKPNRKSALAKRAKLQQQALSKLRKRAKKK